jgi:hypothetical protein
MLFSCDLCYLDSQEDSQKQKKSIRGVVHFRAFLDSDVPQGRSCLEHHVLAQGLPPPAECFLTAFLLLEVSEALRDHHCWPRAASRAGGQPVGAHHFLPGFIQRGVGPNTSSEPGRLGVPSRHGHLESGAAHAHSSEGEVCVRAGWKQGERDVLEFCVGA